MNQERMISGAFTMRFLILTLLLVSTARAGDPAIWKELAPFFQPPKEFQGDRGDYASPLIFDDGSPVKTPEDWKKRRQEILKRWHGLMGEWPKLIESPKVEVLKSESRDGLTEKHLKIQIAPDKFSEDAYLLLPEGKGPFPAVVVVFYDGLTGIGKKGKNRDFALQLARRGFVTLSFGSTPETYYPDKESPLQPLSFHAYEAANCYQLLANLKEVDPKRIGIVGHSYGGKWAMFASCLFEKFACAAWSDGGIVFDESRSNINYWERWYLGHEKGKTRTPGTPNDKNPRTGPYKIMIEKGYNLHELHALMAPRPFLVSGGSEDFPARWKALNHTIAVNQLLGAENRVGMTNRPLHEPNAESNEKISQFFEYFLK
jgi:dienelactone hydrolase